MAKKQKKDEKKDVAAITPFNPDHLTNTEKAILAAASQLVEKYGIKKMVKVGDYNLHGKKVTITLEGSSRKLEDTMYTPTTSIPYKICMMLMAEMGGCTGPAAQNKIFTVMAESLKLSKERLTEMTKRLKETEEQFQQNLDRLTPELREGRFETADGTIIHVEVEEEEQQKDQDGTASEEGALVG